MAKDPVLEKKYEDRAKLVTAQRSLNDALDGVKEWPAEKEEEYQRMEADINRLSDEIERGEKLAAHEKREADLKKPATDPLQPGDDQARDDQGRDGAQAAGQVFDPDLYRKALESVVRRLLHGRPNDDIRRLTPSHNVRMEGNRSTLEYRDAAYTFLSRGSNGLTEEQRATLQIDSDIGGGYLKPPEQFINRLIAGADSAVPLRNFCTVFAGLKYGDSLGAVSLEGDVGSFEWDSGELTEGEEDTGLEFGKRELSPHKLKRKIIKISRRLLENSRMDVEGIVTQRINVALRETYETAYMTGSGSKRPLGLFTESNDGIPTTQNQALSSTTGPTADDLIDVQDALADAYQPNARWLFHKDFLTKVRKLKDADGQYLWQPGLQQGEPNQLLGKPYTKSDFAPNTFTASQNVAIYGDLSWYWIAEGYTSMFVQRLLEKYAEYGQIGLLFDDIGADAMPVLAEAFVRAKTAAS